MKNPFFKSGLYFIFTFLVSPVVLIHAQQTQLVSCSALLPLKLDDYNEKALCDSAGTIFFCGYYGGVAKIKPDFSSADISAIQVEIPGASYSARPNVYRLFNEHMYAFVQDVDRKARLSKVYVAEIDKEKLTVTGKVQKVFECPYVARLDDEMGLDFFNATIETSEDGSHLVIYTLEGPEGKTADHIHAKIFDSDFTNYFERNIPAPAGTSKFSVTDTKLYDDGTLMICGFDNYEKQYAKIAEKSGKAPFMAHVITISNLSDNLSDYKIDPGSLYIRSFKAELLPDGKIVGAGLYSDDKKELLKGAFYFSFSTGEKENLLFKPTPFPQEFIDNEMAESDLASMKNSPGLKNYMLRDMFVQYDGSVSILAEHIFIKGKASTPFPSNYDIIGIGFNASGKMTWKNRIYKKQENKNAVAYSFSYYAAVYNDQILVFFNDDVKNAISANSAQPAAYTGENNYRLMCVTINPTGDITKQIVASFTGDDPKLLLNTFSACSSSSFVVFAIGGGLYKKVESGAYNIKVGQ